MGKLAGKRESLFEILLRRRVSEACSRSTSTPSLNDLIDCLCTKYPEYSRHSRQLYAMVNQALDHPKSKRKLINTNQEFMIHDDDTTSHSPAYKKAKQTDAKHVACRRTKPQYSEPESSCSSEEHNVGAVLTSEDEQFFDLTKSRLRKQYIRHSKASRKLSEDEELFFDLTKSRLRKQYIRRSKASKKPSENVKEVVDNLVMEAARADDQKLKTLSNDVDNDGPRFKDLGGIDAVLDKLDKVAIAPLCRPELYHSLGVRPSAGLLLHGPPGCGKTKLAHAIANECGVPFYKIAATELVSGVSGASEENIRELFSKAYKTSPSIVFIDEIDAIAAKRDNHQREMEIRIVTQLMTCMELGNIDGKLGYVLVIGATNRPDALDPALRRPGRFEHEIALGVPDENSRTKILSVLTRNVKMEGAFDLVKISRLTPGFVGADLAALVKEASGLAIGRAIDGRKLELAAHQSVDIGRTEAACCWWEKPWAPEELEQSHSITMSDLEAATKLVQASTKREGFSSIPNVKWEDVGGLDKLRRKFYKNIVRNIKYPNVYEKQEDDCETGFLLFGPPGCGKTLIAQAVANEAGANFIHIKGPEILSKYVGESELAVRTIFSRARTCSPCILFLDEVDALTKKRGKEEGSGVERVLTQLLTELDGGKQRKGVYVIGATNMPQVIDPALLRPGRLGEIVYVPLPKEHERALILKALSRNKRLDADVDLNAIARSKPCENLSGDDLSKLIRKAAQAASEEKFSKVEALAAYEGTPVSSTQSNLGEMQNTIKAVHFKKALRKISPSLSEKERRHYDEMAKRFKKS